MKYHVSFDIELKENPYKGKYFALEGIDGSGKSTQLHLVAQRLRSDSLPVVLTSEPKSDSIIGNIIREVLQGKIAMPPIAFQYLYSADRAISQETIVKPTLEKGDILLTHRSFWSVIPYGLTDKEIFADGKSSAEILAVAHGILSQYDQFICPDITFYLDTPVDVATNRLAHMDKVKEIYERKEKLAQIAKGYEWEMQKFPEKFVRIDGTKKESEITEEIVSLIKKQL